MGGVEGASGDAAARQLVLQALDGLRGARHHAGRRRVDTGQIEVEAGAEVGPQRGLPEGHREHGARGDRLHEATPLGHEGERVRQGEDARQVGGHVLSHAVTDHGRRLEPPGHPEPCHRVLDHEERGLRQAGLLELLRRRLGVTSARVQHFAEVEAQGATENLAARVHVRAEDRLPFVQPTAHVDVLRALAREHERHRRALTIVDPALDARGVGQRGPRVLRIPAHHHPPVVEEAPACLERPRGVGEVPVGVGGQVGSQIAGRLVDRGLGLARKHQELPRRSRIPGRDHGRFLDDRVRVRPADAERAEGRPAGPLALPLHEAGGDVEGAVLEVDLGVRRLEVEALRDLPMLEAEHGLDEPGHPRRGVEVADVRLHGPDRAVTLLVGPLAPGLGEAGDFGGVAEGGGGAMGLDVGDGFGVHVCRGQRLHDDLGLAADAGGGEAHLHGAVVVDGGAQDDGAHVVAVAEGVREALQHHDPEAVAEDHPLPLGVEGPGVAVGGKDASLLILIADVLGNRHGDAAGQDHVALVVQQALAREVHRHQGGGAEGLDRVGGAPEIELVGHSRGQRIVHVAEADLETPHVLAQLAVPLQVAHEVAALGHSRGDSDRAREALAVVARILQGFPGALQEEALLRVQDLRLAGRIAKEGRVEELGPVDARPGHDKVGAVEEGGVDPHLLRPLFRGDSGHRLLAVAEDLPERVDAVCSREPPRHADHGDLRAVPLIQRLHQTSSSGVCAFLSSPVPGPRCGPGPGPSSAGT